MSKIINGFKLQKDGVLRKSDGAYIPASNSNRDWQEYQKWLDIGNIPDPEYTAQELIDNAQNMEKDQLKRDLKSAIVWQFRMIQELFEVGQSKGLWSVTDFSPEIRAKYQEWKTKTDRLKVIDE